MQRCRSTRPHQLGETQLPQPTAQPSSAKTHARGAGKASPELSHPILPRGLLARPSSPRLLAGALAGMRNAWGTFPSTQQTPPSPYLPLTGTCLPAVPETGARAAGGGKLLTHLDTDISADPLIHINIYLKT